MANITETIPNLVGGVSEQTESQRQPSQGDVQINGHSTIAEGLMKRAPLEFKAQLRDTPFDPIHRDGVFRHRIRNTSDGDFHLFIAGKTSPEFFIFDDEGYERDVNISPEVSGIYFQDPVNNSELQDRFRAVSIRDTTLLVSTAIKVGYDAIKSDPRPKQTIIFVSGVNYSCGYTISVPYGTTGARGLVHKTAEAGTGNVLSTADVAKEIADNLLVNPYAPDPDPFLNWWDVEQKDNLVILTEKQPPLSNRQVTATDSLGDDYIEVIGETVSSFTKLPTVAPNGFIVTITGETPDSKPYYLKFFTNSGSDETAEGYWKETAKPYANHMLAAFNMPHEIALQPDGSFLIKQTTWGDRIAGDDETAPWPSFVGNKINDIYLDRNRLCLVHTGGVSMSRARSLFEFFPTTVTSLLADAPINVTPTGAGVAALTRAIAFKERVILFGEGVQFAIDEGTLSATQPPALLPVGGLKTDINTLSEAVGSNIYFTTTSGGSTALIEMYVDGPSQAIGDEDVSRHVPSYLPANVRQISASPTADILFMTSADEKNVVWVYKYHWRREEKLQSSWYKFELDERYDILDVTFDGNIAAFIVEAADGVTLLHMHLNPPKTKLPLGYIPRLDWLVTGDACEVNYDETAKRTTVTLPYEFEGIPKLVRYDGVEAKATVIGTNMVEVRGDLSDGDFFAGLPYLFTYTFSKQVMRRQSSSGGYSAIAGGRLSLLRWFLRYSKTGFFKVEVNTGRSKSMTYEYTGSHVGSGLVTVGPTEVKDGIFSFPVRGLAEDTTVTITSDSFLPLGLTSVEWEAKYTRRNTR